VNTVLAVVWMGLALTIVRPAVVSAVRRCFRPIGAAAASSAHGDPAPASAQSTREAELAADKAGKATRLHPYEPTVLEQRVQTFEQLQGRVRSIVTCSSAARWTAAASRAPASAPGSATPRLTRTRRGR
jgi:hypothetical protein